MMLASALFAAILVGCVTAPSDDRIAADASAMIKASFKARGQAGLDRLDQDDTQRLCSQAAGKTPPKDVAERIEKQNLATIRYPADGTLIGDWKNGERIAQDGRGKQYSDDPAGPVGGNCYACHQLAPQ
jgi:sulfur-oxidizing protein SoxX